MAKKKASSQISKANQFYIEQNQNLPPEDLASHTGLSLESVQLELQKLEKAPKSKKGIKLTKSKITLNSGSSVYQMTEELDVKPRTTKKVSKEQDERAGIYRSPR